MELLVAMVLVVLALLASLTFGVWRVFISGQSSIAGATSLGFGLALIVFGASVYLAYLARIAEPLYGWFAPSVVALGVFLPVLAIHTFRHRPRWYFLVAAFLIGIVALYLSASVTWVLISCFMGYCI
jgi:hypothetical protein